MYHIVSHRYFYDISSDLNGHPMPCLQDDLFSALSTDFIGAKDGVVHCTNRCLQALLVPNGVAKVSREKTREKQNRNE